MTPPKKVSSSRRSKVKVAAQATGEAKCTLDQVCKYMTKLAPDHNLPAPPWSNANPKNNWLEEFYEHYKELYEAVVQLEGYVLCSTPAQKPDPIIATPCKATGGNPPQKSGSPPPPPFP